jgi:hypothetical protein
VSPGVAAHRESDERRGNDESGSSQRRRILQHEHAQECEHADGDEACQPAVADHPVADDAPYDAPDRGRDVRNREAQARHRERDAQAIARVQHEIREEPGLTDRIQAAGRVEQRKARQAEEGNDIGEAHPHRLGLRRDAQREIAHSYREGGDPHGHCERAPVGKVGRHDRGGNHTAGRHTALLDAHDGGPAAPREPHQHRTRRGRVDERVAGAAKKQRKSAGKEVG